jgi:hypothetical protein
LPGAGRSAAPSDVNSWQAFTFAAGLVIVGLPGALPYFAAVDQMLRADLPTSQTVLAVFFYNLVFVAPLIAIVVVRQLTGARADGILAAINRFMETWGRRVIMIALIALGFLLVVDGVGWFLGRPVIPVGWPGN